MLTVSSLVQEYILSCSWRKSAHWIIDDESQSKVVQVAAIDIERRPPQVL